MQGLGDEPDWVVCSEATHRFLWCSGGVAKDMACSRFVSRPRVMPLQLMVFYRENFPMAAAIFGSKELLTSHRAAMHQRGLG